MALVYRELELMINEFDYCMRRKCKNCVLDGECQLLNYTWHNRLLWHPFEKLPQILKEKGIKYDNNSR